MIHIAKLEQEISDLRNDLESARNEIYGDRRELAQLRTDLAAAREDGARLDWLEKNSTKEFPVGPWAEWPWETNLRAAIDAARKDEV